MWAWKFAFLVVLCFVGAYSEETSDPVDCGTARSSVETLCRAVGRDTSVCEAARDALRAGCPGGDDTAAVPVTEAAKCEKEKAMITRMLQLTKSTNELAQNMADVADARKPAKQAGVWSDWRDTTAGCKRMSLHVDGNQAG